MFLVLMWLAVDVELPRSRQRSGYELCTCETPSGVLPEIVNLNRMGGPLATILKYEDKSVSDFGVD